MIIIIILISHLLLHDFNVVMRIRSYLYHMLDCAIYQININYCYYYYHYCGCSKTICMHSIIKRHRAQSVTCAHKRNLKGITI